MVPAVPRLKAQLKLAINRLKLVQEKNTAIAKQNRRTMAQLMEKGKLESARIRVENIIQEDVSVELFEILELYCEIALARAGSIETFEKDPRLYEAVYTLVYSAPYTDIKELSGLRDLFKLILPKEFLLDAIENQSQQVPKRVLDRIHLSAPATELVDLYLTEIAKAYKVRVPGLYEPEPEPEPTEKPSEPAAATEKKDAPPGNPPNTEDLMARFAALKKT